MCLKNSQYVKPAAFINRTAVLNSEGFVTDKCRNKNSCVYKENSKDLNILIAILDLKICFINVRFCYSVEMIATLKHITMERKQ